MFRPWRILLGLAIGLGYLLLLQQYGVTTFTTGKMIGYMLVGIVLAVAMPTLATLIPRRRRDAAPAMAPGGDKQ